MTIPIHPENSEPRGAALGRLPGRRVFAESELGEAVPMRRIDLSPQPQAFGGRPRGFICLPDASGPYGRFGETQDVAPGTAEAAEAVEATVFSSSTGKISSSGRLIASPERTSRYQSQSMPSSRRVFSRFGSTSRFV